MRPVLLFTDQPRLEAIWRSACSEHGLDVTVHSPANFSDVVCGNMDSVSRANGASRTTGAADSVVLDASSELFDEDELLASVGIARAFNRVAVVECTGGTGHADLDDLLEELCPGLVARREGDVDRVSALLARRLDQGRSHRFEFVTVSPDGGHLLTILGDGHSELSARPVSEVDDGGDVIAIELSESAESARIELESGVRFRIEAKRFARGPENSGVDPDQIVDGARLGKRLRALRKEAGLTQAELARRTGIHRPNIARVEAGRHTPSLETLSRLATAIGVPTTRVLSEE